MSKGRRSGAVAMDGGASGARRVYEEGRHGRPRGAAPEPVDVNPYHHQAPPRELDLGRIRLLHQSIQRLTELALDDVRHHPYQEMIPRPLRETLAQLSEAVAALGAEVESEKLDPPF